MTAAPHQGGSAAAPATGRSLVPVGAARPAASAPAGSFPLRTALLAAVVGLAAGTGVMGAYQGRHHLRWLGFGQADAAMHRLEDQVTRLQGSVEALRVADAPPVDDPWRGLKHSVDALKQDVEQARTASAATVAQLSAKIDKADHDPLPTLTDIVTRLDRIERDAARSADAPTAKIAALTGRIDRLEKQATPGPVPAPSHPAPASAPMPMPAPAARVTAVPPAKPVVAAASPATHAEVTKVPVTPAKTPAAGAAPAVAGWVLRDVYHGVALVEGRHGGLREVEPGEFLPGAGEIRSIERHGRAWVVMTTRGVIASAAN